MLHKNVMLWGPHTTKGSTSIRMLTVHKFIIVNNTCSVIVSYSKTTHEISCDLSMLWTLEEPYLVTVYHNLVSWNDSLNCSVTFLSRIIHYSMINEVSKNMNTYTHTVCIQYDNMCIKSITAQYMDNTTNILYYQYVHTFYDTQCICICIL